VTQRRGKQGHMRGARQGAVFVQRKTGRGHGVGTARSGRSGLPVGGGCYEDGWLAAGKGTVLIV
jgi:hypothetical protein